MTARFQTGRRGSQFVEAGLMLLPFLALAFVVVDAAWAVFVKAALQQAVREGTRYAVTGQHTVAEVVAQVKRQALGLLDGDQASTLTVNCWLQGAARPDPPNPAGCDAAGKLIEIAVTGYQLKPLAPVLHSSASLSLTVRSADVLEAVP
jgi:Flp pilus assembly protein TadG